MFTNVRHALHYDTSYNGCETRAQTEFAHNHARPAVSNFASSPDHTFLLTINLTLCGHTAHEYMFVVEEPRLTQAGPACVSFLHFQNQSVPCCANQDQLVHP